MSEKHEDLGLKAVARVRGVREQTSRRSLELTVAELQRRQRRVIELTERLASAPALAEGTPAEVLTARLGTSNLGIVIRETKDAVTDSRALVEQARQVWEGDKTRLAAVEHLLERRRARRRAERVRREARELDDIASQRWLRAREAGEFG